MVCGCSDRVRVVTVPVSLMGEHASLPVAVHTRLSAVTSFFYSDANSLLFRFLSDCLSHNYSLSTPPPPPPPSPSSLPSLPHPLLPSLPPPPPSSPTPFPPLSYVERLELIAVKFYGAVMDFSTQHKHVRPLSQNSPLNHILTYNIIHGNTLYTCIAQTIALTHILTYIHGNTLYTCIAH